ncbi:MAG: ABC transporter permease [Solirubrobacteraceae bacterium]
MSVISGPGASAVEQTGGGFDAGFEGEGQLPPGIGPWRLAWRRLRRNRVAMFFGFVFLLIVIVCLLAPVYAQDIAHISPNYGNPTGTFTLNGKTQFVLSPIGIPIGPTWNIHHFFFGADDQGRDVAVRLLYGGRTSLMIGAVATLITMIIGTLLGIFAGYYRGFADTILRSANDVIWTYPAVLLGITIGTVLNIHGIGPLHGTNALVPAVVIGFVYIPYVFRPVRGQVLTLRERDYIDAARQQGLSHWQIMTSEILPNLSSTLVVFVPLILANAILLEAGLTFLGAGVQPPNASWGTMISDGINNDIPTAFHNVLIPGIMLVIAVMSINIFGDGLRDALDPRSKVRVAR